MPVGGTRQPNRPPAASLRAAACDEILQRRILDVGADAEEAALALMERHDPKSVREALWLVDEGRALSAPVFDVVADAWDRYFHLRSMPWD